MTLVIIAHFEDLYQFANDSIDRASRAAEVARLPVSEFSESRGHVEKFARNKSFDPIMLSTMPEYDHLEFFEAYRAWGAMMAFDLRNSSNMALEIGPRDTFITMHTYMRVMLRLIACAKGTVIGLRGDGAIGAFGLLEISDVKQPTQKEYEKAIRTACDCGDAMVKSIDSIVNRALKEHGLPAGLRVGVGIDTGNIVVTRIGLGDAQDVTVYGPPINQACKRSNGNNEVVLSHRAEDVFPTSTGGQVKFRRRGPDYVLHYPSSYKTIGQGIKRREGALPNVKG